MIGRKLKLCTEMKEDLLTQEYCQANIYGCGAKSVTKIIVSKAKRMATIALFLDA